MLNRNLLPIHIAVATAVLFIMVDSATAKNILFYGNSFTIGNTGYGVPSLVSRIAVAAGHPAPNTQGPTSGGTSLTTHLNSNTAIISNPTQFSEAPGFQWDYVVLQEFSTRPTMIPGVGDIAGFRDAAVDLFNVVKSHSPVVTPVLYETWARHPNNTSFYRSSYPSLSPIGQSSYPVAANTMQAELRSSYDLARGDLDALLGAGSTRLASVGDAIQSAGWSNLYGGDLYHLNNNGYFLAALVIYGTIYQEKVSEIDLTGLHNFSGTEVNRLKALADAVIVVPLPEPGAVWLAVSACGGTLILLNPRQRGRRQSL